MNQNFKYLLPVAGVAALLASLNGNAHATVAPKIVIRDASGINSALRSGPA
jgi:putative copper export protein